MIIIIFMSFYCFFFFFLPPPPSLLLLLWTENKSVFRLELRNNNITAAGLLAFSHTLKVNDKLYKIMLDVPEYANKYVPS